jgi:Protein of unknown function DUF86
MSSETPSPLPDRDDRLYLRDMVEFCERVAAYTEGHDQESLMADRMRYDAVLRNLELIGEAATRVPANLRELAPRDCLVAQSVPTLLLQLRAMLVALPPAI